MKLLEASKEVVEDLEVTFSFIGSKLNCYLSLYRCSCKIEFNQPFCWIYSVPNLLVFQHLVTLYLGGFVVRVVSEIEC